MNHPPTPEQSEIIAFVKGSRDNLMVDALAGAAKTSTLEMATKVIPYPVRYLVFNKRNADEAKARMPANVEVSTVNSCGHRTLGKYLGRRLSVDPGKKARLLKAELENYRGDTKDELWGSFSDMLKALSLGYASGWIPDKSFGNAVRLVGDDEFYGGLEFEPTEVEERVIRKVMIACIQEAMDAKIDYDDQVFIPTLFPAEFEKLPLTLVDETQDLSPLNHAMLAKLSKRLVAVGDPCQAIYAFRGADETSMSTLRERFQHARPPPHHQLPLLPAGGGTCPVARPLHAGTGVGTRGNCLQPRRVERRNPPFRRRHHLQEQRAADGPCDETDKGRAATRDTRQRHN